MPFYGKIVVIKRSGKDGSVYPLTASQCTIGRGNDCDMRISLTSVAELHCQLEISENGEVCIKNLDVDEPTVLNDVDLAVGETKKLNDGDIFRVADRSFRYEMPRPKTLSFKLDEDAFDSDNVVPPTPRREVDGPPAVAQTKGPQTPASAILEKSALKNKSVVLATPTSTMNKRSASPALSIDNKTPRSTIRSNRNTPTGIRQTTVKKSTSKAVSISKSSKNGTPKPPLPARTPATNANKSTAKKVNFFAGASSVKYTPKVAKTPASRTRSIPKFTPSAKRTPLMRQKSTEVTSSIAEEPKNSPIPPPQFVEETSSSSRNESVSISNSASDNDTMILREKSIEKPMEINADSIANTESSIEKSEIGENFDENPGNPGEKNEIIPDQDRPEEVRRPSTKFYGVRRLLAEEKIQEKSPRLGGVKRLLTEPKIVAENSPKTSCVKRLFSKISSPKSSPKLAGLKNLHKEIAVEKSPKYVGVASIFRVEKQQTESPRLAGVREIFEGEKTKNQNSPSLDGLQELFQSPLPEKKCHNEENTENLMKNDEKMEPKKRAPRAGKRALVDAEVAVEPKRVLRTRKPTVDLQIPAQKTKKDTQAAVDEKNTEKKIEENPEEVSEKKTTTRIRKKDEKDQEDEKSTEEKKPVTRTKKQDPTKNKPPTEEENKEPEKKTTTRGKKRQVATETAESPTEANGQAEKETEKKPVTKRKIAESPSEPDPVSPKAKRATRGRKVEPMPEAENSPPAAKRTTKKKEEPAPQAKRVTRKKAASVTDGTPEGAPVSATNKKKVTFASPKKETTKTELKSTRRNAKTVATEAEKEATSPENKHPVRRGQKKEAKVEEPHVEKVQNGRRAGLRERTGKR